MNKPKIVSRVLFLSIVAILIIVAIYIFVNTGKRVSQLGVEPVVVVPNQPVNDQVNIITDNQAYFSSPIKDALARITKKPFGIKVLPQDSPVQPERFSGYHTGVDFETLPSELDQQLVISAICDGALIFKGQVSGYGGVAIQSCEFNNQAMTVLYGHLKLSSISTNLKDKIMAGDRLGVLGNAYSSETGGERKHLHLGIHLGSTIDYRGYVQELGELKDWLDVSKYLK